jgi:hypothetical protein
VADVLQVDPVALHLGSSDMFNAVGEAALAFICHEDGLAEAEPGWIGLAASVELAGGAVGGPARPAQAEGRVGVSCG